MVVSELRTHKRKLNELEDITNNDAFRNKKIKVKGMYEEDNVQPQQQRSPSPLDMPNSNPPKTRAKSVSFDLLSNQQYENSPLLTPKEDDYYENELNDSQLEKTSNERLEIAKNPDYISLTSSLRLLRNSKDGILEDISALSDLLTFHSNEANKDELINFVVKLMSNDLDLPKPRKIIKSPIINWGKYHRSLDNVNDCWQKTPKIENSIFKSLNVFQSD